MAEEPRQRRPLATHVSKETVPEPEPVHTRSSDPDPESDNEREATELHSVQQSGRRLSRVLSPPPREKVHWYDPVSKFWRHHVRISVPHDDCRDHLGKACVLRHARAYFEQLFNFHISLSVNTITGTDVYNLYQRMNALIWVTCVPLLPLRC